MIQGFSHVGGGDWHRKNIGLITNKGVRTYTVCWAGDKPLSEKDGFPYNPHGGPLLASSCIVGPTVAERKGQFWDGQVRRGAGCESDQGARAAFGAHIQVSGPGKVGNMPRMGMGERRSAKNDRNSPQVVCPSRNTSHSWRAQWRRFVCCQRRDNTGHEMPTTGRGSD